MKKLIPQKLKRLQSFILLINIINKSIALGKGKNV